LKIKKYLAKDIKEALRMIKEDLGPEAVIVSTRKMRGKGLKALLGPSRLEVTAAIDEITGDGGPFELYRGNGRKSIQAPVVNFPESPLDNLLSRELAELKALLRKVVTTRAEDEPEDGFFNKWRKILLGLELDEIIVGKLIGELKDGLNPDRSDRGEVTGVILKNSAARLLEPIYNNGGQVQGRVLIFVGPTGVGKTTTLAKLAAQLTLFHQRKIALVTIDTYRIGAVEQLKTYGEIIGVPLDVVMNPEELIYSLNRHQDKDLILIDTAGRPSGNIAQALELKGFLEVIPEPKDVFLVLSSTTRGRDLYKIVEDYNKIRFNKLIFTKVDETDTLGCIINIAYYVSLPVVYVTDGQNVPDDIDEVYPKKVAKLVFKGVDQFEGSGV